MKKSLGATLTSFALIGCATAPLPMTFNGILVPNSRVKLNTEDAKANAYRGQNYVILHIESDRLIQTPLFLIDNTADIFACPASSFKFQENAVDVNRSQCTPVPNPNQTYNKNWFTFQTERGDTIEIEGADMLASEFSSRMHARRFQ